MPVPQFKDDVIRIIYEECVSVAVRTAAASPAKNVPPLGALGRYRHCGENKRHVIYLSLLQPPIVVLTVVVIEADGLEAKDVNGECIPFRRAAVLSRVINDLKAQK